MRRLLRWVKFFVTFVSFSICVTAVVLWIRSYSGLDAFKLLYPDGHGECLFSSNGQLKLIRIGKIQGAIPSGGPRFLHETTKSLGSDPILDAWDNFESGHVLFISWLSKDSSRVDYEDWEAAGVQDQIALHMPERPPVWEDEVPPPAPPPPRAPDDLRIVCYFPNALHDLVEVREKLSVRTEILVPAWTIAAVSGFLPLTSAFCTVRRWHFRRAAGRMGRCRECGYDLRATPTQCPECGTSVGLA